MPDAAPTRHAAAPIWNGAESLEASRRGLRDLAALLALPAMWVDHDPVYIATGLLGVVFGVLRLDYAYVRFDDPAGGPALERWRPDGPCAPVALRSVLIAAPGRQDGAVTTSISAPSGGDAIRVTSMAPALPGEGGLVLAGSRRTDFPTGLELHLLRVAVGQAAISIHTARRLAGERAARIDAEAALHRRNTFLATLSQDLAVSRATLAEHAAQALAFATEVDQVLMAANVAAGPVIGDRDASRSQGIVSSLASPTRLTRREAEVLGMLAQGLSNKEIAGVLWLSERTVERHITSLYRKIGVERRHDATEFAVRHGLVAADTHTAPPALVAAGFIPDID